MANCAHYNDTTIQKIANEWIEIIERDYNHPCIITWVPLNESWGVPFIATDKKTGEEFIYKSIRSLDNFTMPNGQTVSATLICKVCKGKRKTHGGYYWRYK